MKRRDFLVGLAATTTTGGFTLGTPEEALGWHLALLDDLYGVLHTQVPTALTGPLAGNPAWTQAYVGLVQALACARLGVTRWDLLEAAERTLDLGDPVHATLAGGVIARVTGGRRDRALLAQRLDQYKVDRFGDRVLLYDRQHRRTAHPRIDTSEYGEGSALDAAEDRVIEGLEASDDVLGRLLAIHPSDEQGAPLQVVLALLDAGRDPAPVLEFYAARGNSLRLESARVAAGGPFGRFHDLVDAELATVEEGAFLLPLGTMVRALAEALALCPPSVAEAGWHRLARLLPGAQDYLCTQSHFGLEALDLADAVLGAVVLRAERGRAARRA